MPVTFNAANSSGVANGTSTSHTHTANAGTDVVGIAGVSNVTGDQNVPTWGGNAMTLIENQSIGSEGVGLYYIALGTNPGALTVSASATASTSIILGSITLNGVNQATPTRTHNTASNVSNPPQPTVTVAASQADDWVVDVVYTQHGNAHTAGSNQTSRVTQQPGANNRRLSMSTETATGANTVMSWTGTNGWRIHGVPFVPAGSDGNPVTMVI